MGAWWWIDHIITAFVASLPVGFALWLRLRKHHGMLVELKVRLNGESKEAAEDKPR
jgi:hypothetical protein